MKKLMVISLIILSFGFVFAGDTIKVDPAKSTIGWLGKKVTGQHNGTINLKSGELKMEGDSLTGGSFEIDMTSIKRNSKSYRRDNEKKSVSLVE